MSDLRRLTWLIVWVLVASNVLAQNELPEWPEPTWRYESVEAPLVIPQWYREPNIPLPRFAATFACRTQFAWAARSGLTAAAEQILTTAAAERLSEQQRKLVRRSRFVTLYRRFQEGPKGFPREQVRCSVYAVSREDAKRMAETVLVLANESRRERFENYKQKLSEAPQVIADARAQLPEAEAEIARRKEELEKAEEGVPYRVVGKANEDIQELDKVLRSIEFDITGTRAKVAAIKRLKDEGSIADPETPKMLDRLLIEQDVEMAGLLARRAAVQRARDAAQAFCTASAECKSARFRKSRLQQSIDRARSLLEEGWEKLEDPPENMRPVEIFADKIVIQPVELPDG